MPRARKLGSRQRAKLAEAIGGPLRERLMTLAGAAVSEALVPDGWVIKLPLGGGLAITWWGSEAIWEHGDIAIFARFDDPVAAAAVMDSAQRSRLNHYSGKWNHHYGAGSDAQGIVTDFVAEVLTVAGREAAKREGL